MCRGRCGVGGKFLRPFVQRTLQNEAFDVTRSDTFIYGRLDIADMIVQAEVLDLRSGIAPACIFTGC